MKPLTILRRLIGQVRSMTGWMVLAILLGVAGFLAAILIPVLAGMALIEGGPALLWIMGLCAVLRGVLRYGEQACNHYIAFRLLARIRDLVFGKLRALAPAKLEGRRKGDLISLITSDVELLEVFYAHTISPVAIALIVSLIFVAWQTSLNPWLGVAAAASYAFVGVILPWMQSRSAAALGKTYREESGRLTAVVLETIRGQMELRQYGAQERRLQDVQARTAKLAETEDRLKKLQGNAQGTAGVAVILCAAGLLLLGGWLHRGGLLSARDLVISFLAQISSFGPVIALSNLGTGLSQTLGAGERILSLLDESPATPDIAGPADDLSDMALENVSFAYESCQTPVLENMSLQLPASGILGVCGPSGCGKSTLVRLLMRFWDPRSGQVTAEGRDLRNLPTATLRQAQAFVTQDTDLFHATIAENLCIAKPDATREELEAACRKAAIDDFIRTLPQGYDTMVGELGSTLSGGERQRLGLARAFLREGQFLFLDEPTSNLDSLNEGIILQTIDRQMQGKTVVLITHRKSTLGFADEILQMHPVHSDHSDRNAGLVTEKKRRLNSAMQKGIRG